MIAPCPRCGDRDPWRITGPIWTAHGQRWRGIVTCGLLGCATTVEAIAGGGFAAAHLAVERWNALPRSNQTAIAGCGRCDNGWIARRPCPHCQPRLASEFA